MTSHVTRGSRRTPPSAPRGTGSHRAPPRLHTPRPRLTSQAPLRVSLLAAPHARRDAPGSALDVTRRGGDALFTASLYFQHPDRASKPSRAT
ncbi:hypothetical protein HispidOSU_024539 [Sigmodon hispidus]